MSTLASRPLPVRIIEILGYVGVLFWLTMIVRAFVTGSDSAWLVLLIGVLLGGAHVVISISAQKGLRTGYAAMWFVLIGDSLLTIFVDAQALTLVLFTVVLLLLTRPATARA